MAWAPNYVSPEELAAYMRIGDADDNAQMVPAIAAASREIDRHCRRQFGLLELAEPRYYTAVLDPITSRMAVEIDDLMTTADLAVATDPNGDETFPNTVTSYTLRPRNAPADGEPWTQLVVGRGASVGLPAGPDTVRVTARFGWTDVPEAVKQACMLQASRLMSRRDSPFGVAGSPEAGSEVRLLAKIDPDVQVALAGYRKFSQGFA